MLRIRNTKWASSVRRALRDVGAGRVGLAACIVTAAIAGQAIAATFDGVVAEGRSETNGSHAVEPESVLVQQHLAGGSVVATEEGFFVADVGGQQAEPLGTLPLPTQDGEPDGAIASFSQAFCTHNGHVEQCGRQSCGKPVGLINKVLGDACPRWTVQADTLMLWQGNIIGRTLFTDTATGPTVLNTNQINGPVAVGPRIGLFLHLDQVYAIEANYFSVTSFNDTRTLPAGLNQYVMDNLAGLSFADIDNATATTTAGIQSFELNWREWNSQSFTWIAGFRWVEWNQTLGINDNYTDSVGQTGTDSMLVETGNNLYGAQVGGDVLLWEAHKLVRFNAVGKAGVFYNHAAFQRTALNGDRAFGNFSDVADQTAFFGEVGVNGSVKLNKWLWWRAGYNFFWLSGVAVPSQQLSKTNQPAPNDVTTLNTSGSVLLHGVNTGIEARW